MNASFGNVWNMLFVKSGLVNIPHVPCIYIYISFTIQMCSFLLPGKSTGGPFRSSGGLLRRGGVTALAVLDAGAYIDRCAHVSNENKTMVV